MAVHTAPGVVTVTPLAVAHRHRPLSNIIRGNAFGLDAHVENEDWAYVIFDWDNTFASLMLSLDSAALGCACACALPLFWIPFLSVRCERSERIVTRHDPGCAKCAAPVAGPDRTAAGSLVIVGALSTLLSRP